MSVQSYNHQSGDHDVIPSSHQGEVLGSVRIARRVLRTVVEQAALGVHGVSRMAPSLPGDWPHLLRSPLPQHGVGLTVHDDVVAVELYLSIQSGASMVDVGTRVQEAVAIAVKHILGMEVSEVNVYIQDVT
ncbi:MAG: Asp23/Gls24 family envelope stress response protein [Ktedonobacterales bacterium]